MIWFLILIALVAAIMLLSRRLVRNCQNCSSAVKSTNGYICTHRTALKALELPQIQAGHWRCPWHARWSDLPPIYPSKGGVNPLPRWPKPKFRPPPRPR